MTTLNFLFDLVASQPIEGHSYHGGGKYTKKVFQVFINNNNASWLPHVIYDSSYPLDHDLLRLIEQKEVKLIDINKQVLTDIINNYNIHRFYSALPFNLSHYNIFEALNTNKCEFYTTVHGLRTLEIGTPFSSLKYVSSFKQKFKDFLKILAAKQLIKRDKQRYQNLLQLSKTIAVSTHTAYSIKSYFPEVNQSDIKVFYSPDVTDFDTTVENQEFKQENYLLFVNGNRWLKNNLNGVIALDELLTEQPSISQNAVITGVTNPEIYLKRIKNKHRFVFYKYVDEGLLQALYKNAFGFIYLSLNEGFGYPPLEAMRYGIPVLTSPFTSIPEICDNAALYTNPYSIQEIKNRILQLLNPQKNESLRLLGLKRFEDVKRIQESDINKMIAYLVDRT